MTDSHLTWRPVVPALAIDRQVWMPDLPGCGLSERPDASYALEWYAQVIARWLEQQGLACVDLVGHSFGGGIAQMLLLTCPERIRRIVLVASGGLGREVGFWLRLAAVSRAVEYLGQPFMAFGTRRALASRARQDAFAQDVAALSAMNAQPGTARAFARTVRDVIDWRGQRRLFVQRAHEVRAFPPIAVLWGEQDEVIPVAHGQAFAASMQGVVFRSFPDNGHYVHRERPDDFAVAVREFLDSPSVPRARPRPQLMAAPSWTERARRMLLHGGTGHGLHSAA